MSRTVRSLDELKDRLDNNPQLEEEFKRDPSGTLSRISETPLNTDKWIYRLVVMALGLAMLGGVTGLIVLSWSGNKTIPDGLVAIGSAAVGALAGLLAPPPR